MGQTVVKSIHKQFCFNNAKRDIKQRHVAPIDPKFKGLAQILISLKMYRLFQHFFILHVITKCFLVLRYLRYSILWQDMLLLNLGRFKDSMLFRINSERLLLHNDLQNSFHLKRHNA